MKEIALINNTYLQQKFSGKGGYFFILMIIILISCRTAPAQNEKLIRVLNDTTIIIRGEIIEIDKNNYRLDYYDAYEEDSHLKYLHSKNYQGGGPSWLGIVHGAIKLSDPLLLKKIDFQEEADGLSIESSDKVILIKIGRLIAIVKSDEQVLLEAIQVAENDGMME